MMMIMTTIISTRMTAAATTPAMTGMRLEDGVAVHDRQMCIILYSV